MNEIPNNTVIPDLKYSKVKCSICGKFLYYGSKKTIAIKNKFRHVQWLRCSCGHAELVDQDKINEVVTL